MYNQGYGREPGQHVNQGPHARGFDRGVPLDLIRVNLRLNSQGGAARPNSSESEVEFRGGATRPSLRESEVECLESYSGPNKSHRTRHTQGWIGSLRGSSTRMDPPAAPPRS